MTIPEKPNNLKPPTSKLEISNKPFGRFTKYAEAGFQDHVIPIVPPNAELNSSSKLKEENLGKTPGKRKPDGTWVGRHEWTMETVTPRKILSWDRVTDASIGIRTGKVVGVDVDVTEPELAKKIEALAIEILGPAPNRIGNSPKVLLPYRTTTPSNKITLDFIHEGTGDVQKLEILGTGQQFVAEGIHPKTMKPYLWPRGNLIETGFDCLTEVTQDQIELFLEAAQNMMGSNGYSVKTKHYNKAGNRKYIGDPSMVGDPEMVRRALELIGNEFDYDTWIMMAAAVKAALGGNEEYYEIYEDWCLLYEGNDPEVALQKWRSFAEAKGGFPFLMNYAKKIAYEQNDYEFLEAYESYELQLATEEFKSDADFKEAETEKPTSLKIYVNDVLSPPGLVGEIAKYHDANSIREVPIYGVSAGLAATSSLAANHFAFMPEVGLPASTNLYIMTVGATGIGKEYPRTVVKEILHVADALDTDVDAASEAALLRHLTNCPNGMWMKDEIGRHLEFAANSNGGHQYALIMLVTSLYGLAHSSTSRRTYADGKKTIASIRNPYMTVFATSTLESLAKALNSSAVVDGSLNRFIVIHDPNTKPKFQDKAPSEMSDKLKREIKKVCSAGASAASASDFQHELGTVFSMVTIRDRQFIPILPGDGVMDQLLRFRAKTDDKRAEGGLEAPLWARAYENALRVASVVTIGDSDLQRPVMTVVHAKWAIKFIRWAIQNSISLMENISDNEVERVSKDIEKFIHKVIQNPQPGFSSYNCKGQVPKTQITRQFRKVNGRELDQHLKTLCGAGLIEQEKADTSGRTASVFRLPALAPK